MRANADSITRFNLYRSPHAPAPLISLPGEIPVIISGVGGLKCVSREVTRTILYIDIGLGSLDSSSFLFFFFFWILLDLEYILF